MDFNSHPRNPDGYWLLLAVVILGIVAVLAIILDGMRLSWEVAALSAVALALGVILRKR